MKLRIQGDSIRLRLSRTDLRQLAETGMVEEAMHVAPGVALVYGLRAADLDRLAVEMNEGALVVLVPQDWIEDWVQGYMVGFESEQDAGGGRTLAVLVEKDFDCLHKRPEDTDTFPHPDADAR